MTPPLSPIAIKGKIHPLTDEEDKPYLLIKEGRIELLAPNIPSELPVVDYSNYHIFPGFIDNHCHLLETGLTLLFPNLSGIKKLSDLFEILFSATKNLSPFGLILAFNFEPEVIKEKRFPHRLELDKVITRIPVVIFRRDGHSCVLNTRALLEIFPNEIPEGMELDRYKEPTGLLRGKANEIASQYFKNRLDSEAKRLAFQEGVSFAVKKGITTLVAMTREEDLEILLNLLPSLPIQIVIFPQTLNIKKVKEFGLNRIGGCILIDGSFGSHTAALREEYSDKEGEKGILYFSDEELFNFQKEANENNLQMAFHCIGDRAIEQVLRGFEQIIKENPLRHRIEHCELVPPDLLARLAKIKIYPSVQPAFEYFWGGEGNMYHKRLGERIRFTNPYKSFLNNGLIPLGGSDSPITPLDPILGIKSAISHPNEKERLTRNEALSLFTKWGAEGIFLEDEIGVLKRNYWADFIVLKGDILKGEEGEVLAVYKRGKRIFSSL